MNLSQFSKRMTIHADNLPGEVNRVMKRVGLAVHQTIVLATPVDTGAARSNWRVNLNAPSGDVVQPYSPGRKLGLGESSNAQGAITHGQNVIGRRKPSQDIVIDNNLGYIGDLNSGTSAQAPAMFVETAIDTASHAIQNIRIDTGKGFV